MAKFFDGHGSFEFEPGSDGPATYTHGDQPTVESIGERIEDVNIQNAQEKLKD